MGLPGEKVVDVATLVFEHSYMLTFFKDVDFELFEAFGEVVESVLVALELFPPDVVLGEGGLGVNELVEHSHVLLFKVEDGLDILFEVVLLVVVEVLALVGVFLELL